MKDVPYKNGKRGLRAMLCLLLHKEGREEGDTTALVVAGVTCSSWRFSSSPDDLLELAVKKINNAFRNVKLPVILT
jgi:hypothetical protein